MKHTKRSLTKYPLALVLLICLGLTAACNAEVDEEAAVSQSKGVPTAAPMCHMEIQCFRYDENGQGYYLHQSSAESFRAATDNNGRYYTLTDTHAVELVDGKLFDENNQAIDANSANYFGPGTPDAFTTRLHDENVHIPVQTVAAGGPGITNPHNGDDITQCAQLHYTPDGTQGWSCHFCCNSVDRFGSFR